MITLTEEQRQAVLKGEAVRLPAPELGEDVVLLRAQDYEQIQEALEQERTRKTVARVALQGARKWAQENPY